MASLATQKRQSSLVEGMQRSEQAWEDRDGRVADDEADEEASLLAPSHPARLATLISSTLFHLSPAKPDICEREG